MVGLAGGLWQDKVVIVTGGAGGIGASIVDVGFREGAKSVWFFDVDDHRGRDREAALLGAGLAARFRCVDVTDEAAVVRAVEEVTALHGHIDILVNNAGRDSNADARTMTTAEWDDFMGLDLKASWICSKAVLPTMVDRGRGAIVNLASLHATLTAEGNFPYGVAKAGIAGLTRSLALDFGPLGVRVNTVSPGYTLSDRVERFFAGLKPEEAERIRNLHALRRVAQPEEVAEVVAFIASDAASFVTGANWGVDGGLGARYA